MAYKNSYVPPPPPTYAQDVHLTTPAEDYDLNFILADTPIGKLSGPDHDVELEPLVPSQHAQAIFEVLSKQPDHFKYCPGTAWTSLQEALEWIEAQRLNPANLFMVIRNLKESEGRKVGDIAGLMNYIRTAPEDLTSELGWIFIFPNYQRTHVQTHAASLMLEHAFRLPADGGWGLRRMQWQANDLNLPSVNAALRLGFVNEAPNSLRANRGLSAGQVGSYMGRDGDPLALAGCKVGRSTAMLSITAAEWEAGTQAHVLRLVTKYK